MTRPLRVLVTTPDFPPALGGVQRLVHGVAWQLGQRMEVEVVALTDRGHREAVVDQPFEVHWVPALRDRHRSITRLNAVALARALRGRPDVILSGHVVTGAAALLARRLTGTPFVQLLHGNEIAHRPALTRRVAGRAAETVVVSRHTERLLRATGSTVRVNVIPPGIDLPERSGLPRATLPTVLTIARLRDDYKGHDVMVRALALVRAHVPRFTWVVLGDGPRRPWLEREVASAGLSENVRILGAVSDVDRDAYLERAHVFALPSRLPASGAGEGFGIVYLEAAAHGVPVVAGNVAGALEAVESGVTGLLVDPTDHRKIADALVELLSDADRARALGTAGLAHAEAHAWPVIARRWERVLTEAVGR
jgi:phosphatidylinositol alpha-1,6-mannosyltransferase